MDYETLDWDAEAKRVQEAFELVEPCEFANLIQAGRTFAPLHRDFHWSYPYSPRDLQVVVFYSPKQRLYSVCEDDDVDAQTFGLRRAEVELSWKGEVVDVHPARAGSCRKINTELARAIFRLGLWKDEIGAALGVGSAHERIEWTLEDAYRNDV